MSFMGVMVYVLINGNGREGQVRESNGKHEYGNGRILVMG